MQAAHCRHLLYKISLALVGGVWARQPCGPFIPESGWAQSPGNICAGTRCGSRCGGAEGTMQAARCLGRLWDVLVSTSTGSHQGSLWSNHTWMVLGCLHLPPLHIDHGLSRYSLATSCPPCSLSFHSGRDLMHFMEPGTPNGALVLCSRTSV